jgi:hypothetical protein
MRVKLTNDDANLLEEVNVHAVHHDEESPCTVKSKGQKVSNKSSSKNADELQISSKSQLSMSRLEKTRPRRR